ncbi:ABC transporter ATP-binding protein [Rhizobium mayense]|uniref:ABC transporter ATP-binding protein n=1 Tax=Rhizobium mayense TaxID=1312184 RepID=A0ABT7JRE1_9HYPH|nr:ABC transporter ATP-binding protein [Rhizobium mayense]MDL2398917.1 ABC transporter ATP-binding protein [Rhizobium mayense]
MHTNNNPASAQAHSAIVTLQGVSQTFPSRAGAPAVHAMGPITLDLRQGEFFSIVGPSGCGKSTFLEVLAGLTTPTGGEVLMDGKRVQGGIPDGVGVVFQEDASFPWLTVWKNITFGLKRNGVDQKIIKERAERALALTGLTAFRDSYPAQLSGGMRQRVCIARTLVMEPRLILLDEPFAALDQQTRLLMGDEVLNLWRATGATVVLITHALDEAAMLSDRVGVMSARPGRFIEIIETGWGRDRDSRIASSEEFGTLTAHLWSLLREESIRASQYAKAG